MSTNENKKLVPATTWQAILATTPPYEERVVVGRYEFERTSNGRDYYHAKLPDVTLSCGTCEGERIFSTSSSPEFAATSRVNVFVYYECKNCGKDFKLFCLSIGPSGPEREKQAVVIKYGQQPRFGISLSDLLKRLLNEEDRALFEKGLLAEASGLGIGAFSYYRRVLDSQRIRIFDRVIDAVKALGGDEAILGELGKAKQERQFTRAVESIKQALPKFLYIEGHNPLTLLYDAVSNGLHAESDGDCLDSAQAIRRVLEHLLLKVDEALQSDATVRDAVSKLLAAKAKRTKPT